MDITEVPLIAALIC